MLPVKVSGRIKGRTSAASKEERSEAPLKMFLDGVMTQKLRTEPGSETRRGSGCSHFLLLLKYAQFEPSDVLVCLFVCFSF